MPHVPQSFLMYLYTVSLGGRGGMNTFTSSNLPCSFELEEVFRDSVQVMITESRKAISDPLKISGLFHEQD